MTHPTILFQDSLATVLLIDRIKTKADIKRDCGVLLGKHNLQRNESEQLMAEIADYFVHPAVNPDGLYNDLALLKLSKPLKFTDAIQPICLPFGLPKLPYNKSCYTTGWGTTNYGK